MVGFAMTDMNEDHIACYEAQMEKFRCSDLDREQLLTDLLEKYKDLRNDHDTLKSDYASERDIRRSYQNEVARLKQESNQAQLSLDSSNFVLALIDGDGFIFQDFLLQAGTHGGSEAASILQNAIQEHVTTLYGGSSRTWPIMVHVYLSLDKLAQKLAQVSLLKHPAEFRAFAQSFSVNQPLFSVIDVGQGKERADHRIKEMLRTFSDNPTCKHIIFGGSHDTGYLLNLDQYKHNPTKASRITLLEATPPARGFAELPNFQHARFDAVFKEEPLPEYGQTVNTQSTNTQAPKQPQLPRTSTNRSISPVETISKPVPQANTANTSPITTNSSLAGAPTDSSNSSWATVGKNGASTGSVSLSQKHTSKKRYIFYNKDGQRLDESLPPLDLQAAESLKRRMEKNGRNLCNNWHLNKGKCSSGNFCRFQHEPKLTPAELNALRYKTRTLPCKRRDCENFECYLGHQCSNERDQKNCPFVGCNLKATHGMDLTKYEKYYEDGTSET